MGFLDSLKKMFGGGDAAPTATEDAPAESSAEATEAAPADESSSEEEKPAEM